MSFAHITAVFSFLTNALPQVPYLSAPDMTQIDSAIKADLQHISDHYFTWGWRSTIWLGFGCILEGPELIHELWPTCKQFAGQWVKKLGFVGWIIVATGVIGEGVSARFEHQASGILQLFDEDLIVDAQGQASSAALSAKNAGRSVQIAQDSLANLEQKAGKLESALTVMDVQLQSTEARLRDAELGLTSASKQLDEVEAKRIKVQDALLDLAVCNAPRVLRDWVVAKRGSTRTSVDLLKQYAGSTVIIEYFPEGEPHRAAYNIYGALKQAGWNIRSIEPVRNLPDGVTVEPYTAHTYESHAQEEAAVAKANTLILFLHQYNWQVVRGNPPNGSVEVLDNQNVMPVGSIRVRVGLYPAIDYVQPPGTKEYEDDTKPLRAQMTEEQRKRDELILKNMPPKAQAAYKDFEDQQRSESAEWVKSMTAPCKPLADLTLTP